MNISLAFASAVSASLFSRRTSFALSLVLAMAVSGPGGMSLYADEVRLTTSDTFAVVVNSKPAGTTYRIASGTHRMQWVTPKDGDRFFGENGAVMKGSKLLSPAAATQVTVTSTTTVSGTQIISSGTFYRWANEPGVRGDGDMPLGVDVKTGCAREVHFVSELFVNGGRFKHVDGMHLLVSDGQWYYDEVGDFVYVLNNPTGKTVELSLTDYAFNLKDKQNVTIENLTISHYADGKRPIGAVQGNFSSGVVVRNVDFSYNHGAGLGIGPGMLVDHNRFFQNGRIGFSGMGVTPAVIHIRNNLFFENKQLGYSTGEEGALKVALCVGGVFEQNWLLSPIGSFGIWFDEINAENLIRSNRVEGGNRSIYYEIGGSNTAGPTSISWNSIVGPRESGVMLKESANTMVFENAISDCLNTGITAEDGPRSPGLSHFKAWGNDISVPDGDPKRKHFRVMGTPSMFDLIDRNNYRGQDKFVPYGDSNATPTTFASWKAAGFDANGTHTLTMGTPVLPAWGIPFAESHYGLLPATRTLHLRMDEFSGTTIYNSAVNSNHGTIGGSLVLQPAGGIRLGALQFDQDDGTADYVDAGAAVGNTDAITVAVWVKPRTVSDMIPVSKTPAGASGKGWAVKLKSNGEVRFRIGSDGNGTEVAVPAKTYRSNWMHVAATFSGSAAKVYINGVLKASQGGIIQTTGDTTTALRLGVPAAGPAETYSGLLDDLQVYSSALTDVQVKSLMANLGKSTNDVSAYWAMDEAGGTVVHDFSYSLNRGTATNGPTWTPGVRGYALNFDGANDYVAVPHSPSLNLSGDITLMSWVKPTTVGGPRTVVSKGNAYELGLRDGHVRLELKLSNGSQMRVETANVEISPGQRSHIAAVRSGTTVDIYVNGQSKALTFLDAVSSLGLQSTSSAAALGCRSGGTNWFAGQLDEVRVYSGALAQGEVQDLMGNYLFDTPLHGLRATYYDGPLFTGTSVTRRDPNVNFFWGADAPISGMGADTFSVRWEGEIEAPISGSYTFKIGSDDGSRLWVSGSQVANNWGNHGHTYQTGTMTLVGGQRYPIKMEFYDDTSLASAELRWTPPGGSDSVVPSDVLYPPDEPGLVGTYYDGPNFSGASVARVDANIDFNWGSGAPVAGFGADTFSIRWEGKIVPAVSGTHVFKIGSDDGSRLWINGNLVASHWGNHAHSFQTGTMALTAGQRYNITMEYYDDTVSASAELRWTPPGGSEAIVPASALFHPARPEEPINTLSLLSVAPGGTVASPTLVSAGSRQSHGAAGDVDIPLPLVGSAGVECRKSGNYKVVLTFDQPIKSGSVTLTGIGSVDGPPVISGNQMSVSLKNVLNAQTLGLAVSNVIAQSGGGAGYGQVYFKLLHGDVNGDGAVTDSDAALIQSKLSTTLNKGNAACDVNVSGSLNTTDVVVTKACLGSSAL